MENQQMHNKKSNPVPMYKSLFSGALLGVLLSGAAISPSFAQQANSRDIIALQNQVAQLKAQINQLQAQSLTSDDSGRHHKKKHGDDDASTSSTGLLPDLLTRVNNLEDQQRTMRGELDDLTNQTQSKIDLINKKIDDMNFASGHGSVDADGSKAASVVTTSSTAAMAGSKAVPVVNAPANSGNTLKDGQQALLQGDFTQSAAIARKILGTAEGKKSVGAQFLLAQSLAGQGNYKESALNYYTVYKNFPSSSRAPEALLGVGYSLTKNGEKKAACQALGLLQNKYPNTSDRIKKSAASLSKKASCS